MLQGSHCDSRYRALLFLATNRIQVFIAAITVEHAKTAAGPAVCSDKVAGELAGKKLYGCGTQEQTPTLGGLYLGMPVAIRVAT